MRLKTLTHSKKSLLIAGTMLAFTTAATVGALTIPQSSGADPTPPIVQQVNHNTDELANHEARITNNENNVKDLQNKTNTPASSSNVAPPEIVTPPASAPIGDPGPGPTPPAPTPVTVVKSGYLGPGTIIGHEGDCLLFYSDGTQGYITATVVVDNGGRTDNCQSFVGTVKN